MDDDKPKTGLLADPFCIYPFNSLNIMPSGQAKPCCAFAEPITREDGQPMSVYDSSVGEIWSSRFMRDLRRDLAVGKPVSACSYCYRQEEAGMKSMGTAMTEAWLKRNSTFDRATWESDDYAMPEGVETLDLDLGNLCNLKCRMCNASFSSAIAADPLHSRWAPPGPVAARWKGETSLIAPNRVLGVTYEGLAFPMREDGVLRSQVYAEAKVRASIEGAGVSGFSVRLFSSDTTDVSISANGKMLLDGNLSGILERRFDLPDLPSSSQLEITIAASGPLAVEAVKLLRPFRGNSKMPFSRFPEGDQWFQSEGFLKGELLERPDRLRIVRMIGGEPLLIAEARSLARHLVDVGAARHITLGITTNGTQADGDWLDLFSHFRSVNLAVSVDGVGNVNEYIRYPSAWATIDQNLRALAGLKTIHLRINMTVQAYNLLGVTDLIRYCEEAGIEFDYHLLQHPPHLGLTAMPETLRSEAAGRIRALIAEREGDNPGWRYSAKLETLARAIETPSFDARQQSEFVRFTEEMDAARHQCIAEALPELWAMASVVAVAQPEPGTSSPEVSAPPPTGLPLDPS